MLAAGLIHRVLAAGGKVRVVDVTSGDAGNRAAANFASQQGPAQSSQRYLNYGFYRQGEDAAAVAKLGLAAGDLVFLGYPDGGMWEMKTRWEAGSTQAYQSGSTGASQVPYSTAFRPGAPYLFGEAIADLAQQVSSFGPDSIVLTHPNDAHPDHAATYYLGLAALLAAGVDAAHFPILIPIDGYAFELPTHFVPGLVEVAPTSALPSPTTWAELKLDALALVQKFQLIYTYQSQMISERPFGIRYVETNSYMYGYLATNELYGTVAYGAARYDAAFRKRLALRDVKDRTQQALANVAEGLVP